MHDILAIFFAVFDGGRILFANYVTGGDVDLVEGSYFVSQLFCNVQFLEADVKEK